MRETRRITNSFKYSQPSFKPSNVQKRIKQIKQAEEDFKATLGQRLERALKKAKAAPESLAKFKKVKTFYSSLLKRGDQSYTDLGLIEETRGFINEAQKIHGN